MNGKVAFRAWCEIARLYLCIVGCFLLFAVTLAIIVHFGTVIYIVATGGNIVIFFLIGLFAFLSFLRAMSSAENDRNYAGNVFDLNRDQPLYLGQCIRELCAQRGIVAPEVRIREELDPRGEHPAALFYYLFRRDLMMISKAIAESTPHLLLRALVAHELRHQDASSSWFSYLMRETLKIFAQTWLCATVLSITNLLLLQGRYLASLEVYVTSSLILLVFGVTTKYLDGVMARCNEFKTDLAASMDIGDHQSLAHLLTFLTHRSERRKKLLERFLEEKRRFERDVLAQMFRQVSSQETSRRSCRQTLRIAWKLLLKLPEIVLFTLGFPYLVAYSACEVQFLSHPTDEARHERLARLFGPILTFIHKLRVSNSLLCEKCHC